MTDNADDIGGFFGLLAKVAFTLFSWKVSYPILTGIMGVIVMLILSIGITTLFLRLSAKRFDKGVEIDMTQVGKSKSLFNKSGPGKSLY